MQRFTIRELRERRGWTQADLAARLGVSVGTVSVWERGAHDILSARLRQIARLFGVSMDQIVLPTEREDG